MHHSFLSKKVENFPTGSGEKGQQVFGRVIPVGMSHPFQIFLRNPSQFRKGQARHHRHKIVAYSELLGSHCNISSFRTAFFIRERGTSYCNIPLFTLKHPAWRFQGSHDVSLLYLFLYSPGNQNKIFIQVVSLCILCMLWGETSSSGWDEILLRRNIKLMTWTLKSSRIS